MRNYPQYAATHYKHVRDYKIIARVRAVRPAEIFFAKRLDCAPTKIEFDKFPVSRLT